MAKNAHDWLNVHGDYLYRFALGRLRDPHLAEDVVQETFLAAIKSPSFSEQSAPRTWLTGILKHKKIIHSCNVKARIIKANLFYIFNGLLSALLTY